MQMSVHEKFMKECFKLALKADGKTSPNPLVGAILANSRNEIVAKGWHKSYGLAHAEVDCINNYEKNYPNKDFSDLTLYVNLEPCNHYGKTPPCTDLILKKNIKNVVIAVKDPNPEHSGGIKKLKANGVNVLVGVLEKEAIKLNEVFFKNNLGKKAFVVIKSATTLDGKIATKNGISKWITSTKARNYVQKLRNKYDAILTSSETVMKDNPSLTARGKGLKQPVRIILDSKLKTSPNSKVFNDDGTKVYLFYSSENKLKHLVEEYPQNIELLDINTDKNHQLDLSLVIKKLYELNIKSVLIEAGGTLNGAFLKADLVDKIYHFIAPKILGDNEAISYINGFNLDDIKQCRDVVIKNVKRLSPDIMLEIYLKPKVEYPY